MTAAQTAENDGDEVRLDLTLSMRDIYINSNLNPLKISSHGTSLK